MIQLGNHFSANDHSRHSEWLRQRQWFIKAKQDHQRREESANKLEDDILAAATEAVIATQAQIDAFEAKLDSYDIAITEAMIENREQTDLLTTRLVETELRLQAMLQQAYILEDGRRVFKSEDGTFVIDEFGENVSREEVDFELVIGPTAEVYLKDLNLKRDDLEALTELKEERRQLEKAHELVQEKRELLDQGNTPVQDLEDFDAEILDAMPPSARMKIPGAEIPSNTPGLKSGFSKSVSPEPVPSVLLHASRPLPT